MKLQDPAVSREQAFINGSWIDGASRFEVRDPAEVGLAACFHGGDIGRGAGRD
jgi:hypothetical protein